MSEVSEEKKQQLAESSTDVSVQKLLNDLDKTWWSTEPYEGRCGNCGRVTTIRPQDSGMYCSDC